MQDLSIDVIAHRSAKGVVALVSRTFILNLISFGTFLLIFTVLSARDVGIYTAVVAIQRVISFFSDFGFGAALVQKKGDISHEDISTSFTLQASVTFAIFVLLFLLKGFLMNFFRLGNDAFYLLFALVFTLFLSSFKTIPSILLERTIDFHRLVIPQILESLTFNVIFVVLVLSHFGLSSFTWAFLISSLISIPFYYMIRPWKISFGIHSSSLIHLKFGIQFQIKNVLAAIKDDMLTVFLAKLLSFAELGYIGFSQRLSLFVYRYIVDSVTKVTFSTYSRMQEDHAMLKKTIEKSLFFVTLAMFPALSGLIISAPYFIRYLPGWHGKWEPAIISLVFFSLNAAVSSISGILVNVLDSTGKVKVTLKLMILWTTLTWILTPILILIFGFNGVAVASFLVSLTIFITIKLVREVVSFNLMESIKAPLIATLTMSIFVYIFSSLFVNGLVSLIIIVILGAITYSICIYVTSFKELKNDFQKIFLKQ